MNKMAHKNYCTTLMKVRTEQAQAMDLVPYLEYFLSLDTRAYFIENQEARAPRAGMAAIKLGNQTARAAITMFVNRDIKAMDQTLF